MKPQKTMTRNLLSITTIRQDPEKYGSYHPEKGLSHCFDPPGIRRKRNPPKPGAKRIHPEQRIFRDRAEQESERTKSTAMLVI
ncbi:hypothetical protein [Desulfobacter latus]|uniref:Uncharacterized protein n=1 Tax=Desulfobacter latus TaxID=2292 RepID=A0A850T9W1_9BACT|nr:hypothetical protein [Desulfobacter latus]NWH04156.1 hypothetical protein [Desulfobacter latus]